MRLGLLGFKREVQALEGKLEERRLEVEALIAERRETREKIQMGRQLLELDRRVGELEQKLMLAPKHPPAESGSGGNGTEGAEEIEEDDTDDDSAADQEEEDSIVPVKRLRRRMQQYMLIRQLAEKLGNEHPFVIKQEERKERIRNTLLLDMGSAMKQAVEMDGEGRDKQLYMLGTYNLMGESDECIKVLKQARGGHSSRERRGE